MRQNVVVSTLFSCLMGVLAADGTDSGLAQGTPSTTQGPTSTALVFDPLTPYPVFPVKPNSASSFSFQNNTNLAVNKIKLKKYNSEGNERGQNDTVISESEYTGSAIEAPATSEDLNLRQLRQSPRSEGNPVLRLNDQTIDVLWKSDLFNFTSQPLYLECEWTNSTIAGNSASEIFVIYSDDDDVAAADGAYKNSDKSRTKNNGKVIAARDEYTTELKPSSPSPTATAETTPSTPKASQPASSIGIGTPSAKASLSQGATIGIAVGVSVAGLIVAGVLGWLFCFRRRRNQKTSKTHHMMQSYSSDVGGQAMMADKEMPVVLEATVPQYADSSRPSGDVYAPYSDRSTASPVPQPIPPQHQHHRTTSSNVTSAVASAVLVSPAGASETDISWGRGAPTPTSVIASRYAHLVEEGMTEEEIRRLEEEERQLDAAIENAGRRGHNHNHSS